MKLEGEVRRDPSLRAERFVKDWQRLSAEHHRLRSVGDDARAERTHASLGEMAKGLERDPQVESLLRNRTRQLGIEYPVSRTVSHELQEWLGISRSRGLGR
jgi:hypothetical protein